MSKAPAALRPLMNIWWDLKMRSNALASELVDTKRKLSEVNGLLTQTEVDISRCCEPYEETMVFPIEDDIYIVLAYQETQSYHTVALITPETL